MPMRMRAAAIIMSLATKALLLSALLVAASHANAQIMYPSKDEAYAGCMDFMANQLAAYQAAGNPYQADSIRCRWMGHGLFYGEMRNNLCPGIYCGGYWQVHDYHKYPVVLGMPSPAKNSGPMTCKTRGSQVGNPINVMTGNKYQREVDIASEQGGLGFVRHYNSLGVNPDAGLGVGWTHTYARSVDNDVATYGGHVVKVHRPEGGFVTLRKQFDGTWMADDKASHLDRQVGASGETLGWTYHHDMASEIEHYDGAGRLVRIDRRSSASSLILQYEADLLATVLDSRGRAMEFEYLPNGMISSITDPAGAVYGYRYDAASLLRYVDSPGNATVEYRYGEAGYVSSPGSSSFLTGIFDELGIRYASYTYGSTGRAIVTEHAGGVDRYEINVTLVNNGWPLVKADIESPLGLTTSVELEGNQSDYGKITRSSRNCVNCGVPEIYTYDANENIDTIQGSDGVITDYEQDICGRNLQIIYAPGTADQKTVQNIWKEHGSILLQSDVLDSGGVLRSRARWGYNERDQPLTIENVDPTSGVARTTTIQYCEQSDINAGSCQSLGLVTSIDGPRTDINDIVTFIYRSADDLSGCATIPGDGQCYRKGDLFRVVDPDGRFTEYLQYDLAGRLTLSRDKNNIKTRFTYNARGWLTTTTVLGVDEVGTADDVVTQLGYDPVGQIIKLTQPDGAFLTFTYDAAHRLTGVTDNLGNAVSYTLDGAGNRIQEDTRDAGSTLHHSLLRVYNHLGELETLADADANPTDFAYDLAGNLDTVTDTLGRTTDNDYDALGRLRRSIANVGGTGAERAVTEFEYDARDNLTAVIDPKGLTTSYAYNGLGDLIELASPDTGTTSYAYDSAGNRISQLDARGIESFYSYDALNRLTSIDLPTAGQDLSFAYDTAPTVCQTGETYGAGRLSGFADPSGSTAYCYDWRGNVVRKVQVTPGRPDARVGYTYNAANRLVAMTYPSGAIVTYQRDAGGRITGVMAKTTPTQLQTTIISAVSYLPFGPATQFTFGNGRTLDKTYDANYGIAGITDGAVNGVNLDYTLDTAGNVTGLGERLAGGTTATRTLEYDSLDRLSALKDGVTTLQGFGYDATGNRTSMTTTGTKTYSYPATSHRLTKVGNVVQNHDAAGNTLNLSTTRSFTYDDRGRLAQYLANGAPSREYRYNARGERVAKLIVSNPANNVFYVYDEAGRLLGEYKPNGTRIKEYVWLDDTPVAVIVNHASSKLQYVLTDHLNTPRAVVHPGTNAIVWRWDLTSSAFGEHTPQNDPDGDGTNYGLNLRYPGQYFDSETGLHYNYFRDYDPKTGRYIQPDPIGLAGGISSFSYVGGRPISAVDRLGLAEWHVRTLTLTNRPLTAFRIPYGHQERATFSMHSQCYSVTRHDYVDEGITNNEMLTPGINVVETNIGDLAIPYVVTASLTLNDGQPGRPSSANLAGTAYIQFSVSGNSATGTVTLGAATGSFRARTTGIPDGSYSISGEVDVGAFANQGDTCECPGTH